MSKVALTFLIIFVVLATDARPFETSDHTNRTFDSEIQDFHAYRGIVHIALRNGEDVFFDVKGQELKRAYARTREHDFVAAFPEAELYAVAHNVSGPDNLSLWERVTSVFRGKPQIQLRTWRTDSLVFETEVDKSIWRVKLDSRNHVLALTLVSDHSSFIRLLHYPSNKLLYDRQASDGFVEMFLSGDTLYLVNHQTIEILTAGEDSTYGLVRRELLPERAETAGLRMCFDQTGNSLISFSAFALEHVGPLRYVKLPDTVSLPPGEYIPLGDGQCPGVLDCDRMYYYQVCDDFGLRVTDLVSGAVIGTMNARELVGDQYPALILPLGGSRFVTGVADTKGRCRLIRFFELHIK